MVGSQTIQFLFTKGQIVDRPVLDGVLVDPLAPGFPVVSSNACTNAPLMS